MDLTPHYVLPLRRLYAFETLAEFSTGELMKWSWNTFGLHLGATLLLGLALAWLVCFVIEAERVPGGPNATLQSLAIGGFIAQMMVAALSEWKGWNSKSPLIAGGIVSI